MGILPVQYIVHNVDCFINTIPIYCYLFPLFQTFFNDVVLESDGDKNNIIKDIEKLLAEKAVLEKVNLNIYNV